jgi:protein-S-isoprenylcysteine O-methyltransferase Ste14
MNDMNQIPPALPPQMQFTPPPPADDPSERVPINGIAAAIEAILRQPRRVQHALRQPGATRIIAAMVLVAVVCALIYGVVLGTFSRGDQFWIAPLKIAGGLLIASVICLPSLYIFASLSGSQARLSEMAGLLAGLLLLMTLLLIGFAPVAWLFSESTNSLCWMGALHLLFWGIATLFGLRFLGAGFAATQAKSQAGLRVWAIIFVLVCLQLTTALRPIIGTADTVFPGATEKKFFIKHWLDYSDGVAERENRR